MEADEHWEARLFPVNFSRFSHAVAYLRREPDENVKKVLDPVIPEEPGILHLRRHFSDAAEGKEPDPIVVVHKEAVAAPPFGLRGTNRGAHAPSTCSPGVGWYSPDRAASPPSNLMKFSHAVQRREGGASAPSPEPVWSDDGYFRKPVLGAVEMAKKTGRQESDVAFSGELNDIPPDQALSGHPRPPRALGFQPVQHGRRRLPAREMIRDYRPNPDYVLPRAKGALPMDKMTGWSGRAPMVAEEKVHPPLPNRGRQGGRRWNEEDSSNPNRVRRMATRMGPEWRPTDDMSRDMATRMVAPNGDEWIPNSDANGCPEWRRMGPEWRPTDDMCTRPNSRSHRFAPVRTGTPAVGGDSPSAKAIMDRVEPRSASRRGEQAPAAAPLADASPTGDESPRSPSSPQSPTSPDSQTAASPRSPDDPTRTWRQSWRQTYSRVSAQLKLRPGELRDDEAARDLEAAFNVRPVSGGSRAPSAHSSAAASSRGSSDGAEPPDDAPTSAEEFLSTAVCGMADPVKTIFAGRAKPRSGKRRIVSHDTFYGYIGRAPTQARVDSWDAFDNLGLTAKQRVARECDRMAQHFQAAAMCRKVVEAEALGDVKLAMPRIELHAAAH